MSRNDCKLVRLVSFRRPAFSSSWSSRMPSAKHDPLVNHRREWKHFPFLQKEMQRAPKVRPFPQCGGVVDLLDGRWSSTNHFPVYRDHPLRWKAILPLGLITDRNESILLSCKRKCSGLPKSDLSPSVGVLIFSTGVDHLPITSLCIGTTLWGGKQYYP